MITLTTEQAQQIEDALFGCRPTVISYENWNDVYKARAIITAAKAQEQAEQPVSQEYQDHLVNQSFDWAAMAAKHQFMEGYRIGLAEMREKCAKVMESGVLGHGECAAAIRAINFEGDTGFRPVSEMVAEHKQDPKKAAAIEKAKMRKAEQEPVAYFLDVKAGFSSKPLYEQVSDEYKNDADVFPLYAAPQPMSVRHVRRWEFNKDIGAWFLAYTFNPKAKTRPLVFGDAAPVQQVDLTDAEIADIGTNCGTSMWSLMFARAVIAADREKNK